MNIEIYTMKNLWIEECVFSNQVNNTFIIPRPQSAIAFITAGTGYFREKNITGKLSLGSVFFVPFGATYESRWYGHPTCEFISCHFNIPLFQDPLSKYHVQGICGHDGLINDFHSAMFAHKQNNGPKLLRHIYTILETILPELNYDEQLNIDSRISDAMRYINDNCNKKIYIPNLAKASGLSEAYFYVKFRECVGMTPIEYKNRAAVLFAEELLQHKKMSIEEISESAGFESSIYFRRVFKTITGMTPSEYRKIEHNVL